MHTKQEKGPKMNGLRGLPGLPQPQPKLVPVKIVKETCHPTEIVLEDGSVLTLRIHVKAIFRHEGEVDGLGMPIYNVQNAQLACNVEHAKPQPKPKRILEA